MEVYKMENVISGDAYAAAGVNAAKEEVALKRMLYARLYNRIF